MNPNRLLRDEITYELQVRGHTNLNIVTVENMRKILRQHLSEEDIGSLPDEREELLDVKEELQVCTLKLDILEEISSDFHEALDSPTAVRFNTLLTHLLGRLARLKTDDDEIKAEIKQLQTNAFDLEEALHNKCETPIKNTRRLLEDKINSSSNVEQLSGIELAQSQPSISRAPSFIDFEEKSQAAECHSPFVKLHISKWNIRFSGDGKGLSVNAFLERINDFSQSRNVSKKELINSIGELLSDDALIWYRYIRQKVRNWEHFVELMKQEFEPPDYEVELWEEIRRRTQGSSERISTYIARMNALFDRLPTSPTEEEKLKILRRNVNPYLIKATSLTSISTVDQFLEICRTLEMSEKHAERYKPPVNYRKTAVLEPDLACPPEFIGRLNELTTSENLNTISDVECWNCKEIGHRFKKCPKPRKSCFCFGCGKSNSTRSDCPICKKKSKNEKGAEKH